MIDNFDYSQLAILNSAFTPETKVADISTMRSPEIIFQNKIQES